MHREEDIAPLEDLKAKHKHFMPIRIDSSHLQSVDQSVRGWYEVKCVMTKEKDESKEKESKRHSSKKDLHSKSSSKKELHSKSSKKDVTGKK